MDHRGPIRRPRRWLLLQRRYVGRTGEANQTESASVAANAWRYSAANRRAFQFLRRFGKGHGLQEAQPAPQNREASLSCRMGDPVSARFAGWPQDEHQEPGD